MKSLSIIVPVFNTEKYIRRCLDSLLYNEKCLKDIEIIMVNDGGTDGSLGIIKEYKKRYGDAIVVVDKENGGHGSTINTGFGLSNGKYVKVLDSDDWFNIVDFPELVARLKNETADIVVTNYKRVIVYDEEEMDFIFADDYSKKCDFSEIDKIIDERDFFFRFSMPSMAIKKEALKKVWGDGLLEKTFYVDQQFVEKVLRCANDYIVYNLDIYRHYIGRPDQSVGLDGFYRHRADHERVMKELLKECDCLEDEAKMKVLRKQICLMLDTHYSIYGGRNKSFSEIKRFDSFLMKNYKAFYSKARMHRIKGRIIRRKG